MVSTSLLQVLVCTAYAGVAMFPTIDAAPTSPSMPKPDTRRNSMMPGAFGGTLSRRSSQPHKTTVKTFKLYQLEADPLEQAPAVSDNITSNAKAIAEITYIPSQDFIATKLTYTDLTSPIIGLHIHNGSATTNGPVLVNFCSQSPLPSSLTTLETQESGNITFPCAQQENGTAQWYHGQVWSPYTAQQVKQILTSKSTATNTYVNLHTLSAPNGLIRQQDTIVNTMKLQHTSSNDNANEEDDDVYMYDLDAVPLEALPEVTGINSSATGGVQMFFVPSSGLIVARVEYQGITDQVIGMHLHTGNDTVNGPPVVVFCGDAPLPAPLVNFTVPCQQQKPGQVVTYVGNYVQGVDPEQVKQVLLHSPQNAYFNIHDLESFELVGTNGLIRQQVDMDGAAVVVN